MNGGIQLGGRRCPGAEILTVTGDHRTSMELFQNLKLLSGGPRALGAADRPCAQDQASVGAIPEPEGLIPGCCPLTITYGFPERGPRSETSFVLVSPFTLMLDEKSDPNFHKLVLALGFWSWGHGAGEPA